MTKRFKKTVQGMVYDGVVTDEERKLLDQIAKEENISAIEAEIYIAQELKKRIVKMRTGGGNWFTKNSKEILAAVTTVGGLVFTFYKGKK